MDRLSEPMMMRTFMDPGLRRDEWERAECPNVIPAQAGIQCSWWDMEIHWIGAYLDSGLRVCEFIAKGPICGPNTGV